MKKVLWAITVLLLTVPAFAQDDFGDFGFGGTLTGGDIDALLGGGNGNRNRGGNNNNSIPDPAAALLQMKDLLKLKKVPLSKDQEKALKATLETETKAMRESLEAQFGNRGNNNNQNNQNNQTQNFSNTIAELNKIILKHNTELLTTMKSDLTPEQLPLVTKAEKDKKVCLVMLDLVNFSELGNRGGNRGGGGRGGGGRGGFDGGGFDGGFGGFDGGGFDRGGRGGNNNSNLNLPERPFCTSRESTTEQRLEPLAAVLTKGKKPLDAAQQEKFRGLIEQKLPVMEEELTQGPLESNSQLRNLLNQNQNQNQNRNNNNNNNPQQLRNNIVNTIMQQLGVPNNNNNNGGRGNRGNNNNANNNANNNPTNANNGGRGSRGNNFNPQEEIRKKNEELLDKIAAMLNPDQGAVVRKFKYDEIKSRGGTERYRGIMEEEGTPLTPEQTTQITALINSQNQAIRQFTEQLVEKEIAAAPPQPEPSPAQANEPQNRNQNSVNQNPLAQQIVAKVLPQVSVQKARLEKVTTDTIMKLFTPAQVASYKLNSL